MNIFYVYKKYKEAYGNPISVMWRINRGDEFIPVILKDRKRVWERYYIQNYAKIIKSFPSRSKELADFYDSIQESNHGDTDENGQFITFEYNNKHLKFYGVIENNTIVNGAIDEVFFYEDYKFLSSKDAVVIDIGANIGDTAIYFCLNNAERVIALEPFPYSFNFATMNITTNNLADKIELLKAGYGKDSVVSVETSKSNGLSLFHPIERGDKIRIYSLKTLLDNYGLNGRDDLSLKMDCEGCEYNLLLETFETLKKFKKIQIEFHYGYKNLILKLEEAGFSVTHGALVKSGGKDVTLKNTALANRDLTFGYIYAERDGKN